MHLITVVFLAKPAKFLRPLKRLWVIHGFNSRDSYTFPSSIVHRFQSVLVLPMPMLPEGEWEKGMGTERGADLQGWV